MHCNRGRPTTIPSYSRQAIPKSHTNLNIPFPRVSFQIEFMSTMKSLYFLLRQYRLKTDFNRVDKTRTIKKVWVY